MWKLYNDVAGKTAIQLSPKANGEKVYVYIYHLSSSILPFLASWFCLFIPLVVRLNATES